LGLTILDVFLSETNDRNFHVTGFTPTALGKGDSLMLDFGFMPHDHMAMHYHGHFAHPEILGDKSAVLNIVTDQNAPFGEVGDVFQFLLTATVVPPGDFNDDGTINAADYVVWRKFDGTQQGYDNWRMNFGETIPLGSGAASSLDATVPEPTRILPLVLMLASFALPRHRRLATHC
jgi:hypothetical protein